MVWQRWQPGSTTDDPSNTGAHQGTYITHKGTYIGTYIGTYSAYMGTYGSSCSPHQHRAL